MVAPLHVIVERSKSGKEAKRKVHNYVDASHEQIMEKHKLRHTTNIITNFISKNIDTLP
jgi:hypothetical protein